MQEFIGYNIGNRKTPAARNRCWTWTRSIRCSRQGCTQTARDESCHLRRRERSCSGFHRHCPEQNTRNQATTHPNTLARPPSPLARMRKSSLRQRPQRSTLMRCLNDMLLPLPVKGAKRICHQRSSLHYLAPRSLGGLERRKRRRQLKRPQAHPRYGESTWTTKSTRASGNTLSSSWMVSCNWLLQWIPSVLRKTVNSCWPKTYGKNSWLLTDDGVEHRSVLKSICQLLPPDLSYHQ